MLHFKFLRLIFNNNLLLNYLFISKTLTLVFDSEVVLICSFVLLLPHYCNSAPMECQQKSIYHLHLVQHTIAGFLNSNNKNRIPLHSFRHSLAPRLWQKLFLWHFKWLSILSLLLPYVFSSLLINLSTFWTSKTQISVHPLEPINEGLLSM